MRISRWLRRYEAGLWGAATVTLLLVFSTRLANDPGAIAQAGPEILNADYADSWSVLDGGPVSTVPDDIVAPVVDSAEPPVPFDLNGSSIPTSPVAIDTAQLNVADIAVAVSLDGVSIPTSPNAIVDPFLDTADVVGQAPFGGGPITTVPQAIDQTLLKLIDVANTGSLDGAPVPTAPLTIGSVTVVNPDLTQTIPLTATSVPTIPVPLDSPVVLGADTFRFEFTSEPFVISESLTVTNTPVPAGGLVQFEFDGFEPGAEVTVSVAEEPTLATTAVADGTGAGSGTLAAPGTDGIYTLQAEDTFGNSASSLFEVTAPVGVSISGDLALQAVSPADEAAALLVLVPKVHLIDPATGQPVSTADVSSDGSFEFTSVSPGTYDVGASAPGFLTALLEDLVVGSADIGLTDLELSAGDVSGDNAVAGADISVVVAGFGQSVSRCSSADATCDGFISGADISVVVSNFGKIGPTSW